MPALIQNKFALDLSQALITIMPHNRWIINRVDSNNFIPPYLHADDISLEIDQSNYFNVLI
jgi:hypothetical protein